MRKLIILVLITLSNSILAQDQIAKKILDRLQTSMKSYKNTTINFDFVLEVSSPGINKPLIKIDDYRNHLGSYVDIKLKKIINKKTKISGQIINLQDEEAIELKQNKQVFLIPFNIISECNLDPNYL